MPTEPRIFGLFALAHLCKYWVSAIGFCDNFAATPRYAGNGLDAKTRGFSGAYATASMESKRKFPLFLAFEVPAFTSPIRNKGRLTAKSLKSV